MSLNAEEGWEEENIQNTDGALTSGHWRKRYWFLFAGSIIAAVIAAIAAPVTLSATNAANGNHMCPSYCELYSDAAEVCPYYVSYYVPEASSLESKDECIAECEGAYFSKTHSDTSYVIIHTLLPFFVLLLELHLKLVETALCSSALIPILSNAE